jgi:hypothetical protein
MILCPNFIYQPLTVMLAVLGASMISSLPADEVIRIMAANTTSGTLQSYPTDNLGPVGGLSGPIPGLVETVNCTDPPPLDPALPRFLRLSFERQ